MGKQTVRHTGKVKGCLEYHELTKYSGINIIMPAHSPYSKLLYLYIKIVSLQKLIKRMIHLSCNNGGVRKSDEKPEFFCFLPLEYQSFSPNLQQISLFPALLLKDSDIVGQHSLGWIAPSVVAMGRNQQNPWSEGRFSMLMTHIIESCRWYLII